MKNKLIVLLVLVMIVSTVLVGCGAKEKVDEALIPDNSTKQPKLQEEQTSTDLQSELADRAEEEGVSTAEMERMIEELTEMTAEKYGDTAENYKADLKVQGKMPFDEFSTAADYMGITIKEYYEYEKNKPEMSAEDKETMQGMQNAMKELEGIDLSALEEQAKTLEENAEHVENAGSKETTGDVLELAKYEVLEVYNEENDKNAGYYGIEYTSEKEVSDVLKYYRDILEGTANYYIMDGSPAAVVISGTINGNGVDVSFERDFDNGITYITFVYQGVVKKK